MLAEAGLACVVLDKSRGASGRAATRWRDVPHGDETVRWRVDHGAQVFNPEPGSPADRLVRAVVGEEGLAEIEPPTIPFDDDGTVRPERIRADAAPRLAFRDGYSALGRALAATPGLDLRLSTTVTRLVRSAGAWTVEATGADGEALRLGPFQAVVLTPPAPQAAALVEASALDAEARARLCGGLAEAVYRSQFAVVLGFAEPVGLPHGAYALVNASKSEDRTPHDVAWVALESAKPNRAPVGASLLVAQMSGGWTESHYDADRAEVVAEARRRIEALVGPLPEPLWTDTQRWRYSLPNAAVDAAALAPAEALGLFAAGDAVAGEGRVHLAIENGLGVGARVAAALG